MLRFRVLARQAVYYCKKLAYVIGAQRKFLINHCSLLLTHAAIFHFPGLLHAALTDRALLINFVFAESEVTSRRFRATDFAVW